MDENNNEVQAKKFYQVLKLKGYELLSYSGRNMYGKNCIGYVTNNSPIQELAIMLGLFSHHFDADYEYNMFYDIIKETVTDSMGLGTVFYWPNLPWLEEMGND